VPNPEVLQTGPGHEQEDEHRRDHDHRGSHVGLQQDQGAHHGDHRCERQQELADVVDPSPPSGQERGRERDDRDLGELGGLDRHRAQPQPPGRPAGHGAHAGDEHHHEEQPREQQQRDAQALPRGVAHPRRDQEGQDADRRVHQLSPEEEEARAVVLVGADRGRREHHHQAQDEQGPRRHQQEPHRSIDRRPRPKATGWRPLVGPNHPKAGGPGGPAPRLSRGRRHTASSPFAARARAAEANRSPRSR
jgi:hypothetical protein